LKRYEPGITTAQLDTIFSELKSATLPLLREITARRDALGPELAKDNCLHRRYDEETQVGFGLSVAQRFGYDLNRGRLDKSAHPFSISFGTGDVRITTRVSPDFLSESLFAILHESGHAMYEQSISPSLAATTLSQGASGGVHESQ